MTRRDWEKLFHFLGMPMDWTAIMDQARMIMKAHPGLKPPEYAVMLQHHLQGQPLLGWWLLQELQGITPPPEGKEHGG